MKLCFVRAIVMNEIGGDTKLIYRFSDPDGTRSGKSGWSFGIVQYDIDNNPNAIFALQEMDFTTDEIRGLRDQTIADMTLMDAKLLAHREIVDKWDRKQISECCSWPLVLCNEVGMEFSSEETFIHIADYHNQLRMSRGGKLYSFLQQCTSTVTPEMILQFKLGIPWGQKNPNDVQRRYSNIKKIVENHVQ